MLALKIKEILSAYMVITLDVKRQALYNHFVIKTFRDKETEGVFHRQFSRQLSPDIQQVALRKLRMLNNASTLNDLRIPLANHLEKPAGQRAGQYSLRIDDQWRIFFEWHKDIAYNVEISDYH
jgi:toxin HigB-1